MSVTYPEKVHLPEMASGCSGLCASHPEAPLVETPKGYLETLGSPGEPSVFLPCAPQR